jgi:hypothetical protein
MILQPAGFEMTCKTIRREEALGVSWRFEALHAPLALAGRLVGTLRAVIQVAVLPVFHPRHGLLFRCSIAPQFVSDDDAWNILAAFEELGEELLSGDRIAPSLYQHIEHGRVLVDDGPPQVVTLAVNGEEDLIQMPLVPRSWVPTPELVSIGLPELPAPLPSGFVGHLHAPYA